MDDELYDSPWSSFAITETSTSFNTIHSSTPASLDRHATSLRKFLEPRNGTPYETEEQNEKIGTLRECKWRPLKRETCLSILIRLTYERATYRFIILKSQHNNTPSLLLAKAPVALVHKVQTFLVTRLNVSTMPSKLSSATIQHILQTYLTQIRSPESVIDLTKTILGTLKITLSFSTPVSPHLRSMDIDIPASTVDQLATLSADNQSSFLSELAKHVLNRTGLKLPIVISGQDEDSEKTNAIRISRISCSAFVISTEGRVKLSSKAVDDVPNEESVVRKANEMVLERFAQDASRRRTGG